LNIARIHLKNETSFIGLVSTSGQPSFLWP
jgi:hypothetical protein